MAADNKINHEGHSAVDRALDRFTDLIIEKIQTLHGDWQKPWFSAGSQSTPMNLSGRHYNGCNSLMLMLQAEKMGYNSPVWGTFDRISSLNFKKDKDGGRYEATDESGNKLPLVSVNKGEKSFPVFLTTFNVINNDTKEKISYDDFKNLSKDEQSAFKVFPKLQVYNVFNVAAQTNIKQSRPELYSQIQGEMKNGNRDLSSHPAIDLMIDRDLYYCPICQIKGDDAYYSISKDIIVVPAREQFADGESFATNVLHECAHATGAQYRLNRLNGKDGFGSSAYAKEELTAELSAAVISSQYGLTKHLKNDSAAYLKSWLDSLHESPDFLKTILSDVRRSTAMINQRIEAIGIEMDKGEKADYSKFLSSKPEQQQNEASHYHR